MKEFYNEDLANHIGPESCVVSSNGHGEALTGVRAGWVLSREISLQGADVVRRCGRQHRSGRFGEVWSDPARSETPCMYGTNLRENRESLCSSLECVAKERVENSEEVRPQ